MSSQRLHVLPQRLAVCRLEPGSPVPDWARGDAFLSITRTRDEHSIVVEERLVPEGVRAERGFRAFVVAGPIDFAETGVLSAIAAPLAEAAISLFAVSTFDTDYVLVKEDRLSAATEVLRDAGHTVESGPGVS